MNTAIKQNDAVLKNAIRWTIISILSTSSIGLTADEPAKEATPMVSFTPSSESAKPVANTTVAAPVATSGITSTVSNVGLVEAGIDASGKLEITTNKTAVVTTKEKYKRFSVGQPEIADVTAVGPTTLLVTGKKVGTTQIILWNEQEQSQIIDIAVTIDVQAMRDDFKKMFPDTAIDIAVHNGQISLKGRVPNLTIAAQAQKLAESYSKDIINFLEVGGGQQIALSVRFLEVSRNATNELGFRTLFTDGSNTWGNATSIGGTTPGGLINGTVSLPEGGAITLFGSGGIGNTAFEAFLSALKSNRLARTLAEPTLVALSGEDAEFIAGGEIPVPVPQSGSGGGATITIEYKEFGVKLKYNAVVLGNGRIRLRCEPEVSDLDRANGTTVSGNPVPGFKTRSAKTLIEMGEGQTLALAGLLQRNVSVNTSGTPGLGDIPIIGAFFKSTKYERSETELLILVTPRLVTAMNPDQVPANPENNWRYPNEAQLFGFGDLGGPGKVDADGKPSQPVAEAPRYVGENGFAEEEPVVQSEVAATDSK